MDKRPISTFNSQSTKGISDDIVHGLVSPIFSPVASLERESVASPIFQTPDNKQWIDLDVLSPKLVKELRRQYDPSIKDELHGPLGKGAAKVKAFVRQTKIGFDIRLRRKLNADHDEVTDIHLVPDSSYLEPGFRDEKQPSIAELPAMQNEINELPDSSAPQEMDAAPVPSRASTGSSIGEPLPRYEPRSNPHNFPVTVSDSQERTGSPERSPVISHHLSASQSSIIATPARGLSLRDPENRVVESDFLSEDVIKGDQPSALSNITGEATVEIIDEPQTLLIEKPQITESLHAILAALQTEQATLQNQGEKAQPKKSAEETIGPLKVANKDIYETETDADPPSPISRKLIRTSRRPAAVVPKRKRSYIKPTKGTAGDADLPIESDEDGQPKIGKLLRRQTIPKRLPANSDVETLWSSLIQTQSKILGAEHPLVYQAKSDLAHSRANSHASGSQNLTSLTKSKLIAVETLGHVHPWVAVFTEDLATIQSLLGVDPGTHVVDEANIQAIGGQTSLSSDVQDRVPAKSEDPQARHVRTSLGGSAAPPPVDFTKESHEAAPVPVFADPVMQNIHGAELRTVSDDELASSHARPELPKITTSLYPTEQSGSTADSSATRPPDLAAMWNLWRSPHKPARRYAMLSRLAFAGLLQVTINAIQWVQIQYGPERPVESGKVRVRWTCSCGEQLYDDFVEQRRGAARALEAYLNSRPRVRSPGGGGSPTSPSSAYGNYSFGGSSVGMAPSSQTSWSSHGFQGQGSMRGNGDIKPQQTSSGLSTNSQYSPFYEPPWLLTCANEDRYASKVSHLDMAPHKITSDKELAKSLRDHYFSTINKKWWRSLRIRGLTTIEFVQFEVHQNRFADIRKCPDMPAITLGDYTFEPSDLLPPVGSRYLLHLFKHPEDYDGEMITYLRAPKRNGRLQFGVGWGINLVEGFLADRVWIFVSGFFALASVIFVITWELKKRDVQGASGVAAWILSFTILVVGWLEASLG